ncbi:MAG: hypothetical protein D6753_14725 [Planctomycetota bacterium]|nr:MAG: hypothetical protein D6753_14725 [Planctomycetota bacterium]
MDRILTCECGYEHIVSPSQAGRQIDCPCGKKLEVPSLRELRALPAAEQAVPAAVTESVWRTWRGPTMATAVAVFLICGGMSLRFLMQRMSIDTSYTEETEIQLGNELFDQYGPDALSMVWEDYQTYGIGPKQRPPFLRLREIARQRSILAGVTGGIALLALAGAFGVWLSARRLLRQRTAA